MDMASTNPKPLRKSSQMIFRRWYAWLPNGYNDEYDPARVQEQWILCCSLLYDYE
jgi:hypothetical protein